MEEERLGEMPKRVLRTKMETMVEGRLIFQSEYRKFSGAMRIVPAVVPWCVCRQLSWERERKISAVVVEEMKMH